MLIRQEARRRYTVELEPVEAELVRAQAEKQGQEPVGVVTDFIKTGWTTCFSDSEETR